MSNLFQLKQLTYIEIEDRYKCQHLNREIRRRVIADGRTSYVLQCVECGHTSSPVGKKMALSQNPSPPPYNAYIQAQRRARKHNEYVSAYLAIRPLLAAEYEAYLASPEWHNRREQAMARTKGTCEICGEGATDVHHLTYRNIGAELPDELMPVCRICHEIIHGRANA